MAIMDINDNSLQTDSWPSLLAWCKGWHVTAFVIWTRWNFMMTL